MPLSFRSDVYVWHADGEVRSVSPGNGIYYQPCIHPDRSDVVYAGNAAGPPRLWRAGSDGSGEPAALTPEGSGARHPVYSSDGSRITFTSDRDSGKAPQTMAEMNPSGMPAHGNIFVMDSASETAKSTTHSTTTPSSKE